MKQKALGTLAIIGALAVVYVFAMPSYRQGEPSIAGRRAPDFAMDIDGHSQRLADLKGKVVLLDFWASWCPPCVEETPSLNALQERITAAGGEVLGISQDEDQAAYERFLTDQHVVFPTFRDSSKQIAPMYGTSMFPEAYLIDREGRIASKIVGPQDWNSPELASAITTLLRAK